VTWLYVGTALCAGWFVGFSMWQFIFLPRIDAKHIEDMERLVNIAALPNGVHAVRNVLEARKP